MVLAGTRLSEQPIQKYSGDCWFSRRLKKSGSRSIWFFAHSLLALSR